MRSCIKRITTILVKNLETLVCVFPSPMLIWALQRSQCFKIRVAQHWGGRGHITVRTKVWGVNLKNFLENLTEAVSFSTVCDEYCSTWLVFILDPSAYWFGNAHVSCKLCAGVAKIWLFGPHSACSLIQPKTSTLLLLYLLHRESLVLFRY